MKHKLKIQQKIQLYIISASIIIYVAAIGYISYNAREMALVDAKEVTTRYVHESAKNIKAMLDVDLTLVKTLADAFLTYKYLPTEEWQDLFSKMYNEIFISNPHIYSLWDSWELNAIDPEWDKPTGRYVVIYWREGNTIKQDFEYRSLDGDPVLYGEIKTKTTPSIWEPYEDVFAENKAEKFLMTSINAPIMDNGKYIGIVAVDITLNRFQELVEEIKPFEGSYAYLVSNGGLIAGHPEKDFLNSKIEDLFPEDNIEYNITENILNGTSFSYVSEDTKGVKNYISYAPIYVGETNTPWSIAISVPVKTIMAKANRSFGISLLVGILGILLMTFVIALIGRNITNPIRQITELLKQLAKGHLNDEINIKTGDEIEQMTEALNNSINGLSQKVEFANRIGKGELSSNFDILSDDDALGKSLIEMRSSLINAEDEDKKRKIEDEKRRWANEGLAKFANILRQNNENIENLSSEIIINLVNYLKANQGGLFILNDDDQENIYLEMLSAFAYDRKKFMKKTVLIGEGLIGACAIEKKTIFMTDIPQNYIKITSGKGDANPSSLLIIPLKLENNILGVIEIASFNIFEKHEIEFVEKLAENIASTLSSVKVNIKTSELLERSQQQAEEMAAQEEEMRQNLEELQATQEESSRKSAEMEGLVEALNSSSYVIEYDLNGIIQKINDNYLNLLGLSKEEFVGTHHSGNVNFTEQQKTEYDEFWKNLRNGKVIKETTSINVNQNVFMFAETYTPIKNAEGEIYKILKISNNITDFQKKE